MVMSLTFPCLAFPCRGGKKRELKKEGKREGRENAVGCHLSSLLEKRGNRKGGGSSEKKKGKEISLVVPPWSSANAFPRNRQKGGKENGKRKNRGKGRKKTDWAAPSFFCLLAEGRRGIPGGREGKCRAVASKLHYSTFSLTRQSGKKN